VMLRYRELLSQCETELVKWCWGTVSLYLNVKLNWL